MQLLAAAILLAAVAITYANSMHGVFVYDDFINIVNNPSIKSWQGAVDGTSRPLTNLTFWLHFRLGLTHPVYFHVVNVFLHALNTLLLWGIVLRITRHIDAGRRLFLSTASAVIWAVHPVQAESVTYIVQRAEVLSAAFMLSGILLGLHCTRERRKRWIVPLFVAFVFASLSKPTAVAAPFLLLAADAAIARGFRESWRQAWLVHAVSFASLLVPAMLLWQANESTTSAGFSMPIVTFGQYLLFQPRAIAVYIAKLVWPSTLLIDYGYDLDPWTVSLGFAALIVAGTALAVRISRRGGVSRLGVAWFYIALAPVMLVPLADLFAEHRLYLASAGFAVVLVSALLEGCRRATRDDWRAAVLFLAAVSTLAAMLALRAVSRNADYRDELVLWGQVAEQRPGNIRGHLGVGSSLAGRGDFRQAERSFRMAILVYKGLESRFLKESFRTDYAYACRNLAVLLAANGAQEESSAFMTEAMNNASEFR
jgi:hypothetical protein